MLLLCASQVCCAVVVLRWTVVLVCAWHLYLSSGPTRAVGTEKKGMTPSLLHEHHLWRAMDCKSMVISNKGAATVAVDPRAAEGHTCSA